MDKDKVLLESYDGTMISVPSEKKKAYLKKQEEIKKLLKEGKTIAEIEKLLIKNND